MKPKLKTYQVILDKSIIDYPYLLNDFVETTPDAQGKIVHHMTCTEIDSENTYFEATVSLPPNGEPRKVLLRHSFVVAVLETVNLQNRSGYLREESP